MQAWQQIAVAAGGELLGTGRIQLLPDALPDVHELPEGFSFRRLDPNNSDDVRLIAEFIERSNAMISTRLRSAIDNLDDIIRVVLDDVGDIVTYSAACPFRADPSVRRYRHHDQHGAPWQGPRVNCCCRSLPDPSCRRP